MCIVMSPSTRSSEQQGHHASSIAASYVCSRLLILTSQAREVSQQAQPWGLHSLLQSVSDRG